MLSLSIVYNFDTIILSILCGLKKTFVALKNHMWQHAKDNTTPYNLNPLLKK